MTLTCVFLLLFVVTKSHQPYFIFIVGINIWREQWACVDGLLTSEE